MLILLKRIPDQLLHIKLVLGSVVAVEIWVGTHVDFVLVVMPFYQTKAQLNGVKPTHRPFALNANPTMIIEEIGGLFARMNIQPIIPKGDAFTVEVLPDFPKKQNIILNFEVAFLHPIAKDAVLVHTGNYRPTLLNPVAVICLDIFPIGTPGVVGLLSYENGLVNMEGSETFLSG